MKIVLIKQLYVHYLAQKWWRHLYGKRGTSLNKTANVIHFLNGLIFAGNKDWGMSLKAIRPCMGFLHAV